MIQTTVRRFVGISALLLLATPQAHGTIIVAGGNYSVAHGATVLAQFSVSNSSSTIDSDIEGMTFTVQIGSGTAVAPKITGVDLLTGTIWNGHVSTGSIFTPTGGNQLQYQSRDLLTDEPDDFVDANGLLATVTIDTTGAAAGDYPIKLTGTKTAGSDSALLDGLGNSVAATFSDGRITVVPEPSMKILAGSACVAITAFLFGCRFSNNIANKRNAISENTIVLHRFAKMNQSVPQMGQAVKHFLVFHIPDFSAQYRKDD